MAMMKLIGSDDWVLIVTSLDLVNVIDYSRWVHLICEILGCGA